MERTRIRDRQATGIKAAREAGKRWGGRKPGQGKKTTSGRVMALRAKGLKNAEIALALGISTRTVTRYANP
jgi:DNA invertase Pin-like site-specific DNA recombinase